VRRVDVTPAVRLAAAYRSESRTSSPARRLQQPVAPAARLPGHHRRSCVISTLSCAVNSRALYTRSITSDSLPTSPTSRGVGSSTGSGSSWPTRSGPAVEHHRPHVVPRRLRPARGPAGVGRHVESSRWARATAKRAVEGPLRRGVRPDAGDDAPDRRLPTPTLVDHGRRRVRWTPNWKSTRLVYIKATPRTSTSASRRRKRRRWASCGVVRRQRVDPVGAAAYVF